MITKFLVSIYHNFKDEPWFKLQPISKGDTFKLDHTK